MGKNIEMIEEIAGQLEKLDADKKDRTITMREFNNINNESANSNLFKVLTGNEVITDWNVFKTKFIEHQSNYGFTWMSKPGQGGPISLEEIQLPAVVGSELAEIQMRRGTESGSFDNLIKENLPNLSTYLEDDLSLLEFGEARESFKEYEQKGYSFKFTPGRSSVQYKKTKKVYEYKGSNTRKAETAFGNLIYERLKSVTGLDVLAHAQEERGSGKYRNLDFMGFKIKRHINGDEFLMYSFELKPSNSIEAISQAISQAVNYHYFSHYTYIVIPFFDNQNFYDNERFSDLIDMCKMNDVGVLSVIMNYEDDTLYDITEVVPAKKTELEDSDRLFELVTDSQWEMCPLCNRIVDKHNRRRCGWQVGIGDDSECMKRLMEKKFM